MRPYLRVANVYEDRIDLSDVMEMHFEPQEIPRYELKPGDILLNEGQSRELVGRPAMYRGELPGACFTNSLVRFQPSAAVEGKFALELFRHWLKSGSFQAIGQITTNIAHLGAGRFGDMDFPVPPINEQRRIVAKLDALQARSRRAREALDRIVDLEDELVRAWARPTWPTVSLGEHLVQKTREVGARWRDYRIVGLSNEGRIIERREVVGQKTAEKCRVVETGDIVFNPIRFSIGSIARYRAAEPAIVSPEYQVVATRPTLSAELLVRYLRSPRGRSSLEIETTGSVRYRVYFKDLQSISMPLAPRAEQAKAERVLGYLATLGDRRAELERDLNVLDAALLAKAFRGELVLQNPNDEPADVMLARLRGTNDQATKRVKRP